MTVVVVVIKRQDDFHASVAGKPEIWGAGKTAFSALGDMVITHGDMFNIEKVIHSYPHY